MIWKEIKHFPLLILIWDVKIGKRLHFFKYVYLRIFIYRRRKEKREKKKKVRTRTHKERMYIIQRNERDTRIFIYKDALFCVFLRVMFWKRKLRSFFLFITVFSSAHIDSLRRRRLEKKTKKIIPHKKRTRTEKKLRKWREKNERNEICFGCFFFLRIRISLCMCVR